MSDDGGDFGGPPSPGGASSIHSPRPGTPPNVARAAASVVGDDAGPVLDETASLAATPARSEANLQVRYADLSLHTFYFNFYILTLFGWRFCVVF